MTAYSTVKFDLSDKDKERINDAIVAMREIMGCVSKVYGTYKDYGCLEDAVSELKGVLDGTYEY